MKEKFKKFRKTRIYSFIIVLITIAICILLGSGIAYYQHNNNPTDEGSKYLRAFIMQDYNTMYKLVDKKTSKVSKNKYIEKMRSLRQTYDIDSYDISKVKEKDGTKYITMTCKDENTKKKKDFTVYFSKEGFFNPVFYVDLSKVNEDEEMMANEYQRSLFISAENVLNKYYTAVKNNDKSGTELLNLFRDKKKVKKKIRKTIKKNIKTLTKGSKDEKVKKYIIQDIRIKNVKKSIKYNSKTKQFKVVYKYKYDFDSATNVSVSNSYVYRKNGKRKAKMVITYGLNGDDAYLKNISIIDKKKD